MPRYAHVKKQNKGNNWVDKKDRADGSYSIPKIEDGSGELKKDMIDAEFYKKMLDPYTEVQGKP